MKRYLRRFNAVPMAVFGWKSPNQKHAELANSVSYPTAKVFTKLFPFFDTFCSLIIEKTTHSNSVVNVIGVFTVLPAHSYLIEALDLLPWKERYYEYSEINM